MPTGPPPGPAGHPRHPAPALAAVASALTTALVTVPVFLTAALSVPMRSELRFDEVGLGLGVSTFFACSALSSPVGGWLAQRLGARAGVTLGGGVSVAATAAIGLLATRLADVVALLAVAGVANAVAQPGASLALARVIPARRQGLAFGISQMSVPLAAVLAGVTVPAIALTIGWRWAFALPLPLGALIAAVWGRAAALPAAAPGQAPARLRSIPGYPALLVLAAATTSGAMAVQAMAAFLVESAVAAGLPAGTAGWLLGAGSVCGMATRLAYGWAADRRGRDGLGDVALLMAIGAGGVAGLAAGSPPALLVPATVVAFAAGWGWNGLFNYAVVRRYPQAPALALGVATTGIFIGGALGPLGFGLLTRHAGYQAAWGAAAAALALAAALIRLAARTTARPTASATARATASDGDARGRQPRRY